MKATVKSARLLDTLRSLIKKLSIVKEVKLGKRILENHFWKHVSWCSQIRLLNLKKHNNEEVQQENENTC